MGMTRASGRTHYDNLNQPSRVAPSARTAKSTLDVVMSCLAGVAIEKSSSIAVLLGWRAVVLLARLPVAELCLG